MTDDSDPVIAQARRLVEDAHRDRKLLYERWTTSVVRDELEDLIKSHPEHKEWLLESLRGKIKEETDSDVTRQE